MNKPKKYTLTINYHNGKKVTKEFDNKQDRDKEVELKKAKEYLKGKMVLELEDSREVSNFFGLQELLEEKIRTPKEVIANIEKVTSEDIQSVAKEIFKNNGLNLAIVGPYKDNSKFEKILKFIRTTKTSTGLTVKSYLSKRRYKKGKKISKSEMKKLEIKPHDELPKLNYTLHV